MLSIFSCACRPSVCLLWKNVYSGPFSFFKLDCFIWFLVVWVVYIVWILTPYQTSFANIPHLVIIVVQSLGCVWLFVTPQTAAHQATLSFPVSQSLLKFMPIESAMLSDHLVLCCLLLLLPSIFPSVRVFSNESALCIRWPKYWSSALATVLPMNIQAWFPLGLTGWISLPSKGSWKFFSNTTIQKHQFFSIQLSL